MQRDACTHLVVDDRTIEGGTSFAQQIPHVYEPTLAQLGEVDGVADTLSDPFTDLPVSGDEPFGFKSLDMGVDLPVIDADSFCDIAGGVTTRLLSQVADNRRPQGVRVKNTQSISNLMGKPGNRLVDARHSIILAYLIVK
jgi:hypothetical protein